MKVCMEEGGCLGFADVEHVLWGEAKDVLWNVGFILEVGENGIGQGVGRGKVILR
jgi:hypothetical protein